MKTLPEYFVIKRDENNPLWAKYIEWLEKESGVLEQWFEPIYK
jgi:hypothetical protein